MADLLGGGTATATFVTDLVFSRLQTFAFDNAFDNVTAVRWTQTAPYHSFDNIVVNAVNNVPEPASAALLCLGLAGVGFARRRQAA
ncbi:PEP-CTERM sorting domain-containing protein [Zoogloea sp.]|uniref:PEP-CTERM sorting domain-containing protein n=1 Tax=Zoogloea sp. TaxID=49181 RepID=UPI002624CF3D|nr:PEP-CTERM sorting domain-containing protein [Zoogloea sp.]MDD3354937.1 PEP-CTERM sorting domain-containing protein [Zoogloea sp.]